MNTITEKISITLTVNNRVITRDIDPATTLLTFLREDLGLTGVKDGCGEGECGACTVLLDGQAVNSCLVLAGQVDGREVLTIEGLATSRGLHPVQKAFIDAGAVQCGFCTPGAILTTVALLQETPAPTEEEIRTALAGNLCRCTGYTNMIEAVQQAAGERNHD